ncbi:YceD family protein [Thiotrichales bacterium 19S11-10]|nr:YceD family protein [Thiotrichales bacterium 19S11-10]MCF6807087.1 YceD family protein [Thiotrichales bacterium 19S9-11]MCF6811056.1 YceD family protein [Thiotrichales bacterium 19S9-12]
MKTVLPTQIDPARYARESRSLKGAVPQHILPRLKEALYSTNHAIDVELSFHLDGQGYVVIEGHLKTIAVLECQRTLEPFEYSVDSVFKLVVVRDDRMAETLSKEYEPCILDENGLISPLEVIEEEILLSLPLVAKKELKDCDLDKNKAYYGILNKEVKSNMQRPFEGLLDLMKQKVS